MDSTRLMQVVDEKLNAVRGEFIVLAKQLQKEAAEPNVDLRAKVIERAVKVALEEMTQVRKPVRRRKSRKAKKRQMRHWTSDQKLSILSEAVRARGEGWGKQRRVCQKYGITTAHLTQWKTQLNTTPAQLSANNSANF